MQQITTKISKPHRDTITCKTTLRKFLVKNVFYSIDKFLSINCDAN